VEENKETGERERAGFYIIDDWNSIKQHNHAIITFIISSTIILFDIPDNTSKLARLGTHTEMW
jgi:hypothetical protein